MTIPISLRIYNKKDPLKRSQNIELEFLDYINRYKPLIIKVASLYALSDEDKKDLIQEITVALWTSFQKMDNSISESSWTNRIALNTSISYARKRKNRRRREQIFVEQEALFSYDSEIDQKLTLLREMVNHLKSLDKAIIILHLEGKKNNEIAEIMGLTVTNISTRINRIKNKLIKQINPKS